MTYELNGIEKICPSLFNRKRLVLEIFNLIVEELYYIPLLRENAAKMQKSFSLKESNATRLLHGKGPSLSLSKARRQSLHFTASRVPRTMFDYSQSASWILGYMLKRSTIPPTT